MNFFKSRILASSPMLLILLCLFITSFFDTTAGQVGVCYGMLGTMPSPSEVVALYKEKNIQRMRLFVPDPNVLVALNGSNIELIVGIDNHDLQRLATYQTEADKWVNENIQRYVGVTFRYINVGNEAKPQDGMFLLQAMQNIDKAVSEAGLNVKVSTTIASDTATIDTYPPSRGRFKDEYKTFLEPVIGFLVSKKSPLLVNLKNYFNYMGDTTNIHLDYALFTSQSTVVTDGPYLYNNLFDANVDSIYAALEKSNGGLLDIVVSETGWPTNGGVGTSVDNAKTYVNKLIQHVKSGTPRKPGKAVETYLFAMFDENNKNPDYEKFWGLFHPDRQPKYEVEFN